MFEGGGFHVRNSRILAGWAASWGFAGGRAQRAIAYNTMNLVEPADRAFV